MDVVGERWALLIVRELLFGAKRFRDLREGLPGISQNVLSQRLRELEQSGVVRHARLGPPASVRAYELTARGSELEATLLALSRWGASLDPHPGDRRSVSSFMLLLKALYTPERRGGRTVSVRLSVGEESFDVVADDRIEVVRSRGIDVDVSLRASVQSYWDLIFDTPTVPELVAAGSLQLDGSADAAELFFTLFSSPDGESGSTA
jgi:DNA-binding HxlR family transcriptional regulator